MVVVCKEHSNSRSTSRPPKDDLSILVYDISLISSPFAGLFSSLPLSLSFATVALLYYKNTLFYLKTRSVFFFLSKHSFPMHSFTVFTAVSLSLVAAFIVPRAAFPSNSLEVPLSFFYIYISNFIDYQARSSLFDREVGQSGLSNDKVDVDDDDDDDDDDCTSTTAPPTATVISSHNRTATSPQNPGPTNPATHAGGMWVFSFHSKLIQ